MPRTMFCCTIVLGGFAVLSSKPTAAQGIAQGQYAHQNLIPGPARSPGGMVSRGVVRAAGAVTPLQFTEIVETEPQLSLVDQLRIDAIDILIEELNTVFVFLVKQAFARAGVTVDETATGLPAEFDPSDFLAGTKRGAESPTTPTKGRRAQ